MNIVFIDGNSNEYIPRESIDVAHDKTITVNELIDVLEYYKDTYNAGDTLVYLRNDEGYIDGIRKATFKNIE